MTAIGTTKTLIQSFAILMGIVVSVVYELMYVHVVNTIHVDDFFIFPRLGAKNEIGCYFVSLAIRETKRPAIYAFFIAVFVEKVSIGHERQMGARNTRLHHVI